MPLNTNLDQVPYNDSFSESSDYHMVLFKPSVSVQVRELNEVQSMIQQQIGKFGDNIFVDGTVIEGVNLTFNDNYNYVKIKDLTVDGISVTPEAYVGMYVYNSKGLLATVINSLNGFESTDPNLNTLYLNYINSGNNFLESQFSAGDVLCITNPNSSIFSITINNGGANFTNADSIIFSPALVINTSTSASFTEAETITSNSGARATVLEVNSTAISGSLVLKIKPLLSDLSNPSSNTSIWTFKANDNILGTTSGAAATISGIVGNGAYGYLTTDGSGRIVSTTVPAGGAGFTVAPWCGVKITQSSSDITDLDLSALNYLANVTVSSTNNAVGQGYQASVTEGTIYSKGFFVRAPSQQIIVSPYSSQPNNVSLVFQISESIINSNQDQTLLDNVTGDSNSNAPGADRLKLVANLTVISSNTISGNNYFPIASFSEGNVYSIQTNTTYSEINDEISQRMSDATGNFVLDQFQVTTRSTQTTSYEGNTVSYVVDPGKGYISGYRVQTSSNYIVDVPKGIQSNSVNINVGLNYDSYIRVNELGGLFQFSTGDIITFYDTAKAFISNTSYSSVGNVSPVGSSLGTARIRSMILESGVPGTSTAIYRLYLFDISIASGKNFRQIRSASYQNGTFAGIADIVLDLDTTTQANQATLYGNNSSVVFNSQAGTIQQVNNVIYTYRTVNNAVVVSNTGMASISLAGNPSEYFPYTANLNFEQLTDLYVAPLNSLLASNTITGSNTVVVTSANVIVTGTSTTFINDLAPGDYIYILNNSTANAVVKRIVSISNNTTLTVDSVMPFTANSVNVSRYFPKNVPIPFGARSGLTANVDVTNKVLTLNLGFQLSGTTSQNSVVAFNVKRQAVDPGTKTVKRKIYVKINPATNPEGLNGPWCLGIPEVIRLNNVFVGNSSVNTSSTDLVSYFYVDSNENPDYSDLSWLYVNPKYSYRAGSSDYFLVCFDALVVQNPGYYTSQSYITANSQQTFINDSLPLANLGSAISTWEVPEFYDNKDNYYDLLTCFDFRPIAAATATYTNVYTSASLNPSSNLSFGNTTNIINDMKFPLPTDTLTSNVKVYLSRIDSVVVGIDSTVRVIQGTPGLPQAPTQPNDTMLINNCLIPNYPTLEQNPSNTVLEILNTRLSLHDRANTHTIQQLLTSQQINVDQPQGYTMSDIAKLESRIKALEYYTSLTELESNVQTQTVVSSIDPSLNRFKYGFFVDSFADLSFTETDSPECTATIFNNQAVPHLENINLAHNGRTSLSFVEFKMISQNVATYSQVSTNVVYSLPVPCSTDANVVQFNSKTGYTSSQGIQSGENGQAPYDIIYTNMANLDGICTLYFYNQDYCVTAVLPSNVAVDAFNGVVSLTPSPLTQDDIAVMAADPVFQGINLQTPLSTQTYGNTNIISTSGPSFTGLAAQGCGKYTFSHAAASGQSESIYVGMPYVDNYYATSAQQSPSVFKLIYPVNSNTYIDCYGNYNPPVNPPPSNTVNITSNNGTVTQQPTPDPSTWIEINYEVNGIYVQVYSTIGKLEQLNFPMNVLTDVGETYVAAYGSIQLYYANTAGWQGIFGGTLDQAWFNQLNGYEYIPIGGWSNFFQIYQM